MRKYTKHRVVKFKLDKSDPSLLDLTQKCKGWIESFNRFFYNLIESGEIDLSKSSSQYPWLPNLDPSLWIFNPKLDKKVPQFPHCKIREHNIFGFADFLKDIGLGNIQTKYWRGISQYCMDRYLSFYKRNKKDIEAGRKQINLISIKVKEVQFKNQMISHDPDSNTISILMEKLPTLPIKLEYDPKGSFLNHVNGLGSSQCKFFGGNLLIKQGIMAACTVSEEIFAYDPVGAIGIDINKSPEAFFQISKSIKGQLVFPKPDSGEKNHKNMTHLERVIKFNNTKLSSRDKKKTGDRPFNHKVANSLRKKNKNLHRKHRLCCNDFLEKTVGILDFAEENQLLVCLDGVATGQQNGTFGQDKITPELIKQCENRGIPFIQPPTPYTSQMCPECNYASKANRPNLSPDFKCVSCSHTADAQFVGAYNTERMGLWLWEQGFAGAPTKAEGFKWQKLVKDHFLSSAPLPLLKPRPIQRKRLKSKRNAPQPV